MVLPLRRTAPADDARRRHADRRRGAAGAEIRIPPGHPEGYLEAFARLYADFAAVIRGGADNPLLPTLADGVEGVQFITAAIKSSKADGKWTGLGEV